MDGPGTEAVKHLGDGGEGGGCTRQVVLGEFLDLVGIALESLGFRADQRGIGAGFTGPALYQRIKVGRGQEDEGQMLLKVGSEWKDGSAMRVNVVQLNGWRVLCAQATDRNSGDSYAVHTLKIRQGNFCDADAVARLKGLIRYHLLKDTLAIEFRLGGQPNLNNMGLVAVSLASFLDMKTIAQLFKTCSGTHEWQFDPGVWSALALRDFGAKECHSKEAYREHRRLF